MNQVYVCGTYFQVYVSILKYIYRDDKQLKSLIILNDHTPEIEKIISALRENEFFDYHLLVPFRKIEDLVKKKTHFLDKIYNRNKNAIRYVELHSDIAQYHEFFKNSEFNLFYNFGYPSAYFILKYPENYFRIIEDGSRNYSLRTSNFKFFKRKYILNTFIGDGFDDSVKEVNVQYPDKLDARIRHKATMLKLREMQDNLSLQDNKSILNVFMRDVTLSITEHKKLIILTQPLSEDKFITEAYKIQLFTQIIKEYGQNYEVFLKPHPRDLTDYKKHINHHFIEISRAFPLEMFDLMKNITFDVGVTIYSSAMDNVTCITKKVILGRQYVKELLPGKKLF